MHAVRHAGLDLVKSTRDNTLRLSFDIFQNAVLYACSNAEYDRVESAVNDVECQAQSFTELAEQWGIMKLDELQVHQLLTLLQQLEDSHAKSRAYVSEQLQLQVSKPFMMDPWATEES